MADPAPRPPAQAPSDSTAVTSRRGHFWVGVTPDPAIGVARGPMYVYWEAPAEVTQPYPIVLVHGGGGQGLDFLWVTDHNTVSHHPHLSTVGKRYGIRLLPGQEVTTADGHANAFGDVGWVDFREPASSWLAQVAASGGLLSVNHPVAGDCAWRDPGGPVRPLPPVAEVWHSSWSDPADGAPLAWWDAAGRPAPIGGSDVHDPARDLPGAPTTWVLCEDDDVLAGMAAGRTAVSSAPDAPVLLRVEGELVAIDADGAQLVCRDGRRTPVHGIRRTLPGHPGPHVLERTDRRVLSLSA